MVIVCVVLMVTHARLAWCAAEVAKPAALWIECVVEFAGAMLVLLVSISSVLVYGLLAREATVGIRTDQVLWIVQQAGFAALTWVTLTLIRRRFNR